MMFQLAPSCQGRPDAFRIRALAKAVEKAAAKATMAGLAGAEMATAMASWTSLLWNVKPNNQCFMWFMICFATKFFTQPNNLNVS